MDDANNYAQMDMAHEGCTAYEHCDKWHCPYVDAPEKVLYRYNPVTDKFEEVK